MNELEIIRHRQIDGLSVFFNTLEHRTAHMHPEWELIWILDQPMVVTCGIEQWLLEPGQMALFNPKEPHEFHKTETGCTFLCLQISPEILPVTQPVYVDGRLPHRYLTHAALSSLQSMLRELVRAYLEQQPYFSLRCVGLADLILHQLLTGLPSHELSPEETARIDRRNARLQRLLRFVDENYTQKIRLTDFAQMEGCSVSHLSRFIKNTLNQSFQEYVTSVRFQSACRLMADGEKRMLDVCMASGFSDYRYFSREFQRQYAMTPEEYSRRVVRPCPTDAVVRRSLHSEERFFSREESLLLAERYLKE